jgi:hypothetical protein
VASSPARTAGAEPGRATEEPGAAIGRIAALLDGLGGPARTMRDGGAEVERLRKRQADEPDPDEETSSPRHGSMER